MMLGRILELKYLNDYYDKDGSQMVVVYGQKNMGKTHLVQQFIGDKPFYYYKARSASEKEQMNQWNGEFCARELSEERVQGFREQIQIISQRSAGKLVVVIDDFHNMVKSSDTFMKELAECIKEPGMQILALLCTSAIGWVENSMEERIGELSGEISGLLKLKELPYCDLVENFQGFRKEECIEAYAILGGMPGLWKYFDDKLTIKDNICRNILSKKSSFMMEAECLVSDELRETSVYFTLLSAMAQGIRTLNDLYNYTGFSRAKISVYLKNLMELELVEKLFSYDMEGKSNAQKGIYRIKNHFVSFYFTYLYSNLSMLEILEEETFYIKYIKPSLKQYVSGYYKKVCSQYMDQLNRRKSLPFQYTKKGEWIGADGSIDFVAQDEKGNTLAGNCIWDKPIMTYEDYEGLLTCLKQANLDPEYIYLFCVGRFDEKLNLESKVKKNIRLVSVDEF